MATRADIIKKIQARIDELSPFEDNSLNPDINLIDKVLDDSAKTIMLVAPLHLLSPIAIVTTSLSEDGGIVKIPLDDNFIRLHSIKLTEWKTEVNKAITPDDPLYKLQKYEALRGGVQKPVVVLKNDTTGKYLECYSCGVDSTVKSAFYIKELGEDAATFPDNICDIISWQCAADVILIMKGDPSGALMKVQECIKIQTN